MNGTGFDDPEPREPLTDGEVRVWRVTTRPASDLAAHLEHLDEEERKRADCFLRNAHRERFVRAHAALRVLLAEELSCTSQELRFGAGDRGKPFLLGGPGNLEFNLSHSGDYALCALARGRAVGVDVERERPKHSGPEIARRFFSRAEAAALESWPLSDRNAAFFRTWASKEAFIKATGRGLAQPLSAFDVSLDAPLRLLAVRGGSADNWDLRALDVAPAYAGAVVAHGKDWRLVTCSFQPLRG